MAEDYGYGADAIGVGALVPLGDGGRVNTVWTVQRWDEDQTKWTHFRLGIPYAAFGLEPKHFAAAGLEPYSVTHVYGNLVTTSGWTRASNLLTNQGGTQALTSTAVRIGAGDGAGTAAAGDTDLSASAGSTHRWFQVVTGAGIVSTNTLAFTSVFGTADGNFAWNEFGIDVGTPTVTSGNTVNALLYNHKTSIAQGTKASGQTWTATATFTYT